MKVRDLIEDLQKHNLKTNVRFWLMMPGGCIEIAVLSIYTGELEGMDDDPDVCIDMGDPDGGEVEP